MQIIMEKKLKNSINLDIFYINNYIYQKKNHYKKT